MQPETLDNLLPHLRSRLSYEPCELKFGTSGRRGMVADLTQLEIYINALAELEHLQELSQAEGGIVKGEEFFFAYDLRPSSSSYVAAEKGRGEIAQAIERAIQDAGMEPVNLGRLPTPALTCYALSWHKGSMMITGSHIPFDRNGYKTNTSRGELLKKHEGPIGEAVRRVRERIYSEPSAISLFSEDGCFKVGHTELSPEDEVAKQAYIQRYVNFFRGSSLNGMRLLFYQHSAVGRDLVVEILRRLGADVIPVGRSETFVPIDTENIDDAQLSAIQSLASAAIAEHGMVDAVVSTDGDSDRPLVLAVDSATSKVSFFGGDLVGMVVAEYLGADAVVVPISCNDGIDRGTLAHIVEPKTRIGSPYVIAGIEAALAKGRQRVCGWEANGGFLTGSDFLRDGHVLTALPTRDAVLPIVCTLFSAREKHLTLEALFSKLPQRFSRAALLRQFPRVIALKIVERFSPSDEAVKDAKFAEDQLVVRDQSGAEMPNTAERSLELQGIRKQLSAYFSTARGFETITGLNYTDGVRITVSNGDVAHLRPSGNADELRIYAVADTQSRAEVIATIGVAEPDGILRAMEKAVSQCA
jgi:phosphomannomutase